MATLALLAFWGAVALLWGVDGRRIPMVFMGLWVAVDIAWTHYSGAPGVMMTFEGVAALVLAATALVKVLRKRRLRRSGGGLSPPAAPGG